MPFKFPVDKKILIEGKKLAKMAKFDKYKNDNFICQILDGKHFILDSLYRSKNRFFNILFGLRHRADPIYNIWKSPLVTLGDFGWDLQGYSLCFLILSPKLSFWVLVRATSAENCQFYSRIALYCIGVLT